MKPSPKSTRLVALVERTSRSRARPPGRRAAPRRSRAGASRSPARPTTCPTRANRSETNGSVCVHFSTIARMKRGGSTSMKSDAPMSAASIGTWPEWFEMSSTRPAGTCSLPKISVRKYLRWRNATDASAYFVHCGSRPNSSTPVAVRFSGTRASRSLNSSPSLPVIQSSTPDVARVHEPPRERRDRPQPSSETHRAIARSSATGPAIALPAADGQGGPGVEHDRSIVLAVYAAASWTSPAAAAPPRVARRGRRAREPFRPRGAVPRARLAPDPLPPEALERHPRAHRLHRGRRRTPRRPSSPPP